ncbi:MAG: aldehyde dehydrogenase family protein [Halobacteriaceae archaeon]
MLDRSEYDLFIDGRFTPASGEETITTVDPATEEPLAEVAAATAADVDRAVAAGRDTFAAWRDVPGEERYRHLLDVARVIRNHADELARLECLDNGKPLSQARGDVLSTARYFEYYAGIADKVHGESIPLDRDHVDYTIREPLGTVGVIVPWNFPLNILGRSVSVALATGNTAVVKPAEQTPLSALRFAELVAAETELPDGAVNVVPGYGDPAGAALSGHPDVDGVSFTGSVVTGIEVAKQAVDNVTPVHLELGGKSPNVVFPDADLEDAVANAITAIFTTGAGQVCSAGSRLLVHEDVHDEVLSRLVERTAELSIGPGVDDPDVGPLNSRAQFEKVTRYIDVGREEVGDPVLGGEALDRPGYFVEPTIFDGVDTRTRIAQEEIFGPVLTVTTFADEAEAIELANDVDYGLVAGVFTGDVGRAHRFAREVQAGQVFVNEWFPGGEETPFGGYKQSGFGREKGLAAVDEFTQTKNVCANVSAEGSTLGR